MKPSTPASSAETQGWLAPSLSMKPVPGSATKVLRVRRPAPSYDCPMTVRRVLWERTDVPGFEWCELGQDTAGDTWLGVALLAWEGEPYRVSYRIGLDSARLTRRVSIVSEGPGPAVVLELEADGRGTWRRDGAIVIESPGALDVDLGFSPSTNSLPIRRLELAIGDVREIEVAWVLFPSFEVQLGRQTYERLGERTWRYRSVGFEADLTVDEDGLVDAYAEWRAVARG